MLAAAPLGLKSNHASMLNGRSPVESSTYGVACKQRLRVLLAKLYLEMTHHGHDAHIHQFEVLLNKGYAAKENHSSVKMVG